MELRASVWYPRHSLSMLPDVTANANVSIIALWRAWSSSPFRRTKRKFWSTSSSETSKFGSGTCWAFSEPFYMSIYRVIKTMMKNLRREKNVCNLGDSAASIWNGPGIPARRGHGGSATGLGRFPLLAARLRSSLNFIERKLWLDFCWSFRFFSRLCATAWDKARRLAVWFSASFGIWTEMKWNWLTEEKVIHNVKIHMLWGWNLPRLLSLWLLLLDKLVAPSYWAIYMKCILNRNVVIG